MDLQNLDAALTYIICETFCLHCHDEFEYHREFPNVCSAEDTDAKTLRYALVSLSTVCKSWGYIALKTLHHHFGFSEANPEAEILFCRTLCENPELAKQVKQARLRHISSTDTRVEGDWLLKSLDKFSNILDIQGTDFNIVKWGQFIGALILLQILNLEFLETIAKDLYQIIDKFKKPLPLHRVHFPQRLKSLDIKNKLANQTGFHNPLDLSEGSIGGLMSALPNLQHVELMNPSRRTLRDPRQLHNIRHIAPRSVVLGREELRVLVSATGPLESFLYQGASCHGAEYSSIQDICEVLALRKNTLKELTTATSFPADNFTAGARLINVHYMRMALEDICFPAPGIAVQDDQILYIGKFLVYMYSDRETMEHSPNSIHNSAWELIQKKCGDVLKHGHVVLRPFWRDDEDEDG
ncbi:uncharacterized protein BKA55DRAFT_712247 [Fusarium redolens]|uniref:Uncharacterized protein n=1 Tax=Fusarium redolens TaxID=48865 RepID=A0A9P9KS68_FUSRE|nr:uncharacterized protein BKA55DRAFT_712247 [Fusarium redolens]KAH7267600.1 hypothetical protein BKA55DRAFT_712247 [Fusarium redolens]